MALSQKTMHAIVLALRASSNGAVRSALAAGDYGALTAWCNADSTTKAWPVSATKQQLFAGMNLATYDNLNAGKKEVWQLMLSMAPLDMTLPAMRNGIVATFATADANAMLASLTEWASNAEALVGGSNATAGTVTALVRKFVGQVDYKELRQAFH